MALRAKDRDGGPTAKPSRGDLSRSPDLYTALTPRPIRTQPRPETLLASLITWLKRQTLNRVDNDRRENFAPPAIARDVLRHVLPQALCEAIDLERLTISTDTFVTEALRNGERVRELLELITKVSRDPTALDILESLLRYYVQGTGRLDETQVRRLLEQTLSGEPLMETFIDKYIAQGEQRGEQRGEANLG